MDGTQIILDSAVIGFIASALTEVIKLIPWFSATKTRKRVLALGVSVIATAIFAITSGALTGLDAFASFVLIMISSYGTYKSIIKIIVGDNEE